MPRGYMAFALALLVAVEVPIYWMAYQPFHGVGQVSDSLTGLLAVSTAVLMVGVPHLAARYLRRRADTGSFRAGWIPSLGLVGLWIFLSGVLGTVRAKFVMPENEPEPAAAGAGDGWNDTGTTEAAGSLIDRLGLEPWTVHWLFIGLLLVSGGIGLLLGLSREHPFLDAYRSGLEKRDKLLGRRQESVIEYERCRATADTAEARKEDRRAATEDLVRAARELHEAAAHAYLDGVLLESKEPAVTEAAMRLSAQWPLLPMTRS
ncbi:hypothetical protein HW445_24030 [Streptomyces sp. UH6]|nr:hypothetical protein [Streptomyces sp. UH6]